MNKIQILIPEPCHENWQNMTPTEKGKFCSLCHKTVVDFTKFSDAQLINHFKTNETACGRFNAIQLNRSITETKKKPSYFGYLASTALAFLGFGTSTVFGQEKPKTEQTDQKNLQNQEIDGLKTITGKITGEDGPLVGAMIKIVGTKTGVSSGFNGEYTIKAKVGDVLEASYVGAPSKSMTIGAGDKINFLLKSSSIVGVVVITRVVKDDE